MAYAFAHRSFGIRILDFIEDAVGLWFRLRLFLTNSIRGRARGVHKPIESFLHGAQPFLSGSSCLHRSRAAVFLRPLDIDPSLLDQLLRQLAKTGLIDTKFSLSRYLRCSRRPTTKFQEVDERRRVHPGQPRWNLRPPLQPHFHEETCSCFHVLGSPSEYAFHMEYTSRIRTRLLLHSGWNRLYAPAS